MELSMLADFVWPALILEARMRSVWPIAAGFAFEFFILRYVFPMSWKKAAFVDIAMNAVSGLAGIVLLPLAGFLWEFPASIIYNIAHVGTFNPLTWAATCAMAVFISTGIEVAVVAIAFSEEVTKRRFWSLALANLGSTAIAGISLLVHPPRL